MTLGRTLYQLGYEISPILLVGGIASAVQGGILPIVALTQASDFDTGLLSGSDNVDLDQFLCHWKPLPGTTLMSATVGTYPFANQAVAGNAVISQPLHVSMLMACPVQLEGGYASKYQVLTSLVQSLAAHSQAGGTYTVVTLAGSFPGCILQTVRDVSSGESKQPQHTWQFDFIQPLTSLNQAQQVYNSLMSKIAGGLPTSQTPAWSGPASVTTLGGLQSFGSVPPTALGVPA